MIAPVSRARLRSLVTTRSNGSSTVAAHCACAMPSADNGESARPCHRFSAFQVVCPWRTTSISVGPPGWAIEAP